MACSPISISGIPPLATSQISSLPNEWPVRWSFTYRVCSIQSAVPGSVEPTIKNPVRRARDKSSDACSNAPFGQNKQAFVRPARPIFENLVPCVEPWNCGFLQPIECTIFNHVWSRGIADTCGRTNAQTPTMQGARGLSCQHGGRWYKPRLCREPLWKMLHMNTF